MLVVDLGSELKPELEPSSQQDSQLREFCLRDAHSFGTHESRVSNKTPEKNPPQDREPAHHTDPTISKSKSKVQLHAHTTPTVLSASFKQKFEDKENLNPQTHYLNTYSDDAGQDTANETNPKPPKREAKYKIDEGLFLLDDKTLKSTPLTENSHTKSSPLEPASSQRLQDVLNTDQALPLHGSPANRFKPEARPALQARTDKPSESSLRTIAAAIETPALATCTSSSRPHRKRDLSDDHRKPDPSEKAGRANTHFRQDSTPQSPDYGYNKSSSDSTGGILLATDRHNQSEEEQGQVVYSKMYVESLQELHKTELESLTTKHHYEKEQLRKEFEQKLKKKAEEASHQNSNATAIKQLKHTIAEFEQIMANLKHQNALLREENSLFRKSEFEREREFEEYKRDIESRVSHMKNALYAEILR
jgi:hypothetical protein